MRRLLILPLLFFSLTAAAAGNEAELQRLQSALSLLNQEQQAVYQQFQMVQELRRTNPQAVLSTQLTPLPYSESVPNYNDVVEVQKSQIRRADELARKAEDLYQQYSEIEDRKKPLQQRIYDLTISK